MTPEQELELAEAEAEAADQPDAIDPASPLAKAAAEQTGDVLEIQTPTGPWRGTREGVPVLSADEATAHMDPLLKQRRVQGLASLAQGASLGLAGPVAGANAVKDRLREYLGKKLTGEPTEALGDTYQKAADSTRASLNEATRQGSPTVRVPLTQTDLPVLPMVGAGLTMGPVGAAPTAAGRVLGAGYAAGLQSGGESDFEPADTATGALAGMALAAPFEGAGALGSWLSKRAGLKARAARVAKTEQAFNQAEKPLNSKMGELRGVGGEQMKTIDRYREVARNEFGTFTPEQVADANAWLQSPEAKETARQAFENLKDNPARLFALRQKYLTELEPLREAATPSAVGAEVRSSIDSAYADQAGKVIASTVPRAITGVLTEALGTGAAVGLNSPGMRQMQRNAAANKALAARFWGGASEELAKQADAVQTIGRAAVANQSRAVDSLTEYLGREADKDEAAKVHFQAGNADPTYQDR